MLESVVRECVRECGERVCEREDVCERVCESVYVCERDLECDSVCDRVRAIEKVRVFVCVCSERECGGSSPRAVNRLVVHGKIPSRI